MGVTLASNPDATADELIVKQWMPYEEKMASHYTGFTAYTRLSEPSPHGNIAHQYANHHAPGYEYKIVKKMVNQFPPTSKATLLLLVSAFVKGDWRKIYDYALEHDSGS